VLTLRYRSWSRTRKMSLTLQRRASKASTRGFSSTNTMGRGKLRGQKCLIAATNKHGGLKRKIIKNPPHLHI
jgi:hypothetical protein